MISQALTELQWVAVLCGSYGLGLAGRGWTEGKRHTAYYLGVITYSLMAVYSAYQGPFYHWERSGFTRTGLAPFRAMGTLENPNALGGLVACALVVLLVQNVKKHLVIRMTTGATLALVLLLCESRSAIIASCVGLAVTSLLALTRRRASQKNRNVSSIKMFSMLFAVCLIVMSVFSKLVDTFEADYESGRGAAVGAGIDKYLTADMFTKFFGGGFRFSSYIDPLTRAWITPHNSYVGLLADIGVIGSLLMLATLGVHLRRSFKQALWPAVAITVVIAVHSWSEEFLYSVLYVSALGWSIGATEAYTWRRGSIERSGTSQRTPDVRVTLNVLPGGVSADCHRAWEQESKLPGLCQLPDNEPGSSARMVLGLRVGPDTRCPAKVSRMEISFTVVIPTFNRKDLVLRTIKSAYETRWPGLEVVVVDDASSDGTRETIVHFRSAAFI